MFTSLLYHGFGIREYKYKNTNKYEGGSVSFRIEQERDSLRCACCGSKNIKLKGKVMCRFKSTPIGRKDIQKRNLNRRFARPKLRKLKRIAIDEISIGEGHRCSCRARGLYLNYELAQPNVKPTVLDLTVIKEQE